MKRINVITQSYIKTILAAVFYYLASSLQGQDLLKTDNFGSYQDAVNVQDSLLLDSILTEVEYLAIVNRYHPVIKQANLILDQGNSYIQKNRGGFDPKLFFDFKDKDFNDKNYYDLAHAGLKIPTWYGVEFKTGWEYSYGSYVNPEHATPLYGLGYAGVSVSLAQGLMMDNRRAELLKAKQYLQLSQNERDNLVNDLLRDAIFQYWDWSAAFAKYELLLESLEDSKQRFTGIRQSFYYGELSVLDTLEAYTQIQLVYTGVLDAEAVFQQHTFQLNNYLWGESIVPLIIEGLVPEEISNKINSVEFNDNYQIADSTIANHPLLRGYDAKIEALEIDRKLKSNNLLPKINVQYNLLSTDYQLNPNEYSTNNYKWGVQLSMPLMLRKERGDLKLTKIKIEQQELKMRLKQQELLAKTKSYKVKTESLQSQNRVFSGAVLGYKTLLRQEEFKMIEGESSLFKLTLREIKMLQASIKLIDLNLKLVKSKTSYIHSSGALYLIK
jgi:outer membrane protein TolC